MTYFFIASIGYCQTLYYDWKTKSRVNYNGTVLYQQHCIKYGLTFLIKLTNLCIDIPKNSNLTY